MTWTRRKPNVFFFWVIFTCWAPHWLHQAQRTQCYTVCTNSSLQSLRGQRSSLSALRGKMNKGIKAFCHPWIFPSNTCDNWWDLLNTYLFVRVRVQKIPIMKHTSYALCKPCWLRGTSTVQTPVSESEAEQCWHTCNQSSHAPNIKPH